VAHARPARPERGPVCADFEFCHGNERRRTSDRGRGYYGTNPATTCDFVSAFRWEESTGYVLLPTQDGDFTRACRAAGDGHAVVGLTPP
jgi:hypothetical protein